MKKSKAEVLTLMQLVARPNIWARLHDKEWPGRIVRLRGAYGPHGFEFTQRGSKKGTPMRIYARYKPGPDTSLETSRPMIWEEPPPVMRAGRPRQPAASEYLYLHTTKGWSVKQIADRYGKSYASVYSAMKTARDKNTTPTARDRLPE